MTTTYMCSGTFRNINEALLNKKTMLYSGEMIEQSEWDKGFVEKEDLLKILATKKSVSMGIY